MGAQSSTLFSQSFLPSSIQQALKSKNLTIRPLQKNDFHNGHLEVLKDLAHVGEISESQWVDRFKWMSDCNGSYFIVVVVNERDKIIGSGSLIVERKL